MVSPQIVFTYSYHILTFCILFHFAFEKEPAIGSKRKANNDYFEIQFFV